VTHDGTVQLRIEAVDFPEGRGDIRVGVQRRHKPGELLEPFAGSAATVSWVLDCALKSEGTDVSGPYIQGGPGGRFVYLAWEAPDGDAWTMFRRAKLMLEDVPADVLASAGRLGLLRGRLSLRDPKDGGPICARVRPPAVVWSAGAAG
jgi:uncharacterized protein DUF5990